jgi:transposase
MRPAGAPKELERRRLRAISLLQEGLQPVEVARRVGVDRRSVRRWRAASETGGVKALAAVKATGRPTKLNDVAKGRLERHLMEGAKACGFSTDLWTCPRVAVMIHRKLGVRYHANHVGRLLHSLGWSPQKPERRAKERDEEEIQRWVKHDWPAIKKKPGG